MVKVSPWAAAYWERKVMIFIRRVLRERICTRWFMARVRVARAAMNRLDRVQSRGRKGAWGALIRAGLIHRISAGVTAQM